MPGWKPDCNGLPSKRAVLESHCLFQGKEIKVYWRAFPLSFPPYLINSPSHPRPGLSSVFQNILSSSSRVSLHLSFLFSVTFVSPVCRLFSYKHALASKKKKGFFTFSLGLFVLLPSLSPESKSNPLIHSLYFFTPTHFSTYYSLASSQISPD